MRDIAAKTRGYAAYLPHPEGLPRREDEGRVANRIAEDTHRLAEFAVGLCAVVTIGNLAVLGGLGQLARLCTHMPFSMITEDAEEGHPASPWKPRRSCGGSGPD